VAIWHCDSQTPVVDFTDMARCCLRSRRAAVLMSLACRVVVAAISFHAATLHAAECTGSIDAVVDAIFAGPSTACDVNGDGAVGPADLTAAILARATAVPTSTASPSFTPSPPSTASPSPTDTVSTTPTPSASAGPSATASAILSPSPTSTTPPTVTPGPCPGGAELAIEIDNQTGTSPVSVGLTGMRLTQDCVTTVAAKTYRFTTQCAGTGVVTCAQLANLAPGFWLHSISVTVSQTRQLEHRTSLLILGAARNLVRFTAFPAVATVMTTDDKGDGSLRKVLQDAAAAPKPLLIQFDPAAFPDGVPTAIQLAFQLPDLAADDVTIDGIDGLGEIGNRIIDAGGDTGSSISALAITGARNHIVGLRLRNAGANNRDVLNISGASADGNVIEQTIVEQAASADGVGVDSQAGKDFADTANVVCSCEISGAADKGIKVTTGAYARVENCWVHDNQNGGIQATLGGHVQTTANLVERNLGSTAQNGLSAAPPDNASPSADSSELFSNGDISRANGASGVSVHDGAVAELRNGYFATNATSGLRVFNDSGQPPSSALVEGTSAVCNGVDGAVVADSSIVDFGGGPLSSTGNNAFTQNNLPQGGANLRNATMPPLEVSAVNDQWEHCGNATTCNDVEIADYDLSDHGADTTFTPAQAQRSQQAPVLTGVTPAKGREGELLRIFGAGFNVIDGHFAQGMCADVVGRNRCVPLRGNCVKINGVSAPVEAVTPTMLVVRWPFTCLTPVSLTVTTDQGPTGATSAPLTVCTNDAAPTPTADSSSRAH